MSRNINLQNFYNFSTIRDGSRLNAFFQTQMLKQKILINDNDKLLF